MNTIQDKNTVPDHSSRMTKVVERNIRALLERKEQEARERKTQDKVADSITRFAGSMAYVYIHLVVYGLWVIWNLGWIGIKPFDPTFVVLAMIASVEAIFLSTFVLISQNRMSAQADKRAELDLQVSLLAEHEVTHLIKLVRAIAHKMDIEEAHDPEFDELTRNVAPEKVMDRMEEHQANIDNKTDNPI